MYAVGIDVSKGKSTVSVFDQRKEMVVKQFDIPHTLTGLAALSELSYWVYSAESTATSSL